MGDARDCIFLHVMKVVDKKISCKITNASVFAMMMIVGIHVLGHGWQSLEKGSTLWWFVAFGQYGVFNIAVPFFFTCSGYFLAGHMEESGWWCRECRKRIETLLVPYVIWSVLFALLSIALDAFVSGHGPSYWCSSSFLIDTVGLSPIRHPRLGPLWYIRALVLFVVVSPVILFFVRRGGICVLVIIYALAGIVHQIGGFWEWGSLFFTYCFNLSGFFFFCAGIYGRLSGKELPKRGHILALVIGLALVFAGAYCNLHGIKIRIPQSGVVIPILLFGVWGFVPERELPRLLTGTTFAIFLLHIPLYKFLGYFYPMNVETVFQWIAKWSIGWGGSLAITLVIGRTCPKLVAILFARRV